MNTTDKISILQNQVSDLLETLTFLTSIASAFGQRILPAMSCFGVDPARTEEENMPGLDELQSVQNKVLYINRKELNLLH